MISEEKMKQYITEANHFREEWAKNDAARDAGITLAQDIVECKDILYKSQDRNQDGVKENSGSTKTLVQHEQRSGIEADIWHMLDIYYPKSFEAEWNTDQTFPVIVSVHGGGWFYGDKELYCPYTMQLASYGFVVVNFNYRRSPESTYPDTFYDVIDVMRFIQKNCDMYHMDLSQLFMVGDSAGAQLVSQYAIYATNEEYRAIFTERMDKNLIVPKKVALNCGIYDMRDAFYKERGFTDWYVKEVMSDAMETGFWDVLSFMNKDFPESYLMCSVNDDLMKHTAPMKTRLEEVGIPFIYREFGQDNESDAHVFHLNLHSKNGKLCNEEEMAFFRNDGKTDEK